MFIWLHACIIMPTQQSSLFLQEEKSLDKETWRNKPPLFFFCCFSCCQITYCLGEKSHPEVLLNTLSAISILSEWLFRKQAMPFLTVDAIIGNQAFQNELCHICLV